MKIISSSIIFAASFLLISCVSPEANNNSNTVSTASIPSSPLPQAFTPSPEASATPLEEQTKIEEENSVEPPPAEDSTSEKIADEVTRQFPEPRTVAILPIRDGYLDESEESEAVTENAAVRLRQSGYIVQTAREANVASALSRTIGRSNAINRASIGRLGTALGIGAIILVGLATAKENEMSVTTSIYASNRGVFEEISKSSWKTNGKNIAARQNTSQCTNNLLVNGDFEQDWERGWKRTYSNIEQGSSVTEIISKDGNMLHMKHEGLSAVSLHQEVSVPKGRIFFQFETKFVAREGPIAGFTGTGTAAFSIIFLDADKNVLGWLWLGSIKKNIFEGTGLVGVPQSPRSNNSVSFIPLEANRNISDRLEISRIARDRQGKLNLSKIRYVVVGIAVGATHESASAEAWVDNLSLEVCP